MMRNTLNEEKLKDRLEGWSAGDAGLAGESQLAEQATSEIDSLCEALTARARVSSTLRGACMDHV